MIAIPDGMRRPAEAERDELKKQIAEARAEIERKDKLIEQIKEEVERSCKSCASSACGCRDYCTEGVILDLIEGKDNAALSAAERGE